MAWHREHMLPLGAVSSHTWRGRDDTGRTALLREVPDGQKPIVATSGPLGIVPLREVTVIEGRRYGVWDFIEAESLEEVCERLADEGRTVPLAVLARVVVDAARALVSVTPGRPHGGLSNASLLLDAAGAVWVMDFGAPRPSRFTPHGPASFGNDVFALGAVLHGALTGFGGSYADAVEEGLSLPAPSQLHDDCTPAVDDVIQRAIARAAEARQPDLELLADELEAVLGEALATRTQVAELLRGPQRSAPPVPDVDPGPALGAEEDAPTGRHELPGTRETVEGLDAVRSEGAGPPERTPRPRPAIPQGTQPGVPPTDGGPVAGERPSRPSRAIPMGTQPGGPSPTSLAGADASERGAADSPSRPRTGSQPRVAHRESPAESPARPPGIPIGTQPGVPPPGIPMGTQPGRPPRDAFSEVAEPAPKPTGIPMTTQPGLPSPALAAAPPDATQPRAVIPKPMASRPSKPAAPAEVPVDTQPRIKVPVPDTSENEVPSGATPAPDPAPAGTAMSHAKLEWAATQERVPTPPVGVPALGDEAEPEPTNVRARVAPTSGTAPVLDSVPSLEAPAASASELPRSAGGGRRAVIAVLLVVVAGLFGAFAWKKQSGDVEVEQVVIGDEDAGAPARAPAPLVDAGALPDTDTGDEGEEEALDGGDDAIDADLDAGTEVEADDAGVSAGDAGAADAGTKPAKKKPVKKKRRR